MLTRTSLVVATWTILASVASAQDYAIEWYTFDGGGVMQSTGGDFVLSGAIGQPDAGGTVAGGCPGLVLAGGFWPREAPPAPCPGDTNSDRIVNLADLAQTLSNFGTTAEGVCGDVDGDGDVDITDLSIVLANFGTGCA